MYSFQYSIVCAFLSIFMFLYGFFLLNYDGEDSIEENVLKNQTVTNSVEKIVFMIIDGIRLDFVNTEEIKSNMPYLHSSTKSNQTCIFPCRVHLPTVTMPRVKALTVGTVPSFVDIALNFGSSRLTKDSIINQLVKEHKKIVFYGDDTWIKLFPDMFARREGTTSFFVSDFFEVDANVTRNVNEELKRDDWDFMILHYLGLDHIGHVEGSFSSKISSKLREMDAVIGKLNHYLLDWKKKKRKNYLLVICGDHGMKDSGGHGGSTLPEVMVPFITLGMPCNVDGEISQVDVAVTLSTLLGLSFPKGNVGKLIKGLMYHLTQVEQIDAYRRNSEQLLNKFLKIADEVSLFEVHGLLEEANYARNVKNYSGAIEAYETTLNKMSETLVRSLTKYDSVMLYCAVILVVQSGFLVGIERCSKSSILFAILLTCVAICMLYEFCYYFACDTVLCSPWKPAAIFSCFVVFILSINTILLFRSLKSLLEKCRSFFSSVFKDPILSFLIICSISHICSSTSTSFIEEEHMIWYFLWTTFLLLIGLQHRLEKQISMKILLLLVLHRILRKLNQTGDKWSALPDINDWFRTPDNKHWLSAYMIFGLICTIFALNDFRTSNTKQQFGKRNLQLFFQYVDCVCLVLVYNCRAAADEVIFMKYFINFLSDRGAFEFQTIFILQTLSVLAKFILLLLQGTNDAKNILEIFINWLMIWDSLLLRPYNIVLISSLYIVSKWMSAILKNKPNEFIKIVIVHHWLALVYFFYQGNSNSFSSIDVTPGYIGQTDYDPVVAGFLIIFSTYALPILAYSFMIRHFLISKSVGILRKESSVKSTAKVWLCLTNFYLALFMTITTIQRNHLFIWSVFSPKMIYLCAYNVLLYAVLVSLHFVIAS